MRATTAGPKKATTPGVVGATSLGWGHTEDRDWSLPDVGVVRGRLRQARVGRHDELRPKSGPAEIAESEHRHDEEGPGDEAEQCPGPPDRLRDLLADEGEKAHRA